LVQNRSIGPRPHAHRPFCQVFDHPEEFNISTGDPPPAWPVSILKGGTPCLSLCWFSTLPAHCIMVEVFPVGHRDV